MSLNWREIDAVLEEIPFQGALIREIRQPSPPRLVLEMYRPGEAFRVLLCFANPTCRLHLLSRSRNVGRAAKTQRFVAFLRAHIRGGRVLSAAQVDRQRIVRIEVSKAGRTVVLWCRLWASAANMIVTDPGATILDALYRRPGRGEVSGQVYSVERDTASTASRRSTDLERFALRDLPGPGTFNQRVERHYFELEEEREAGKLRSNLLTGLRREENRLSVSLERNEKQMESHSEMETFKKWGDLILSNLHTLRRGQRWLSAADPEDPQRIWDIELDPRIPPARNAENYYKRYRKARSGRSNLREEQQQLKRRIEKIQQRIEQLERGGLSLQELRSLGQDQALKRQRKSQRETRPGTKRGPMPGLSYTSGPFKILVGRNARENDELLRHHVRGNDTWLHARDYAGGYVFIRSIPGKSVPLDTLLDAANLALRHSKARGSVHGDVFYTQVKYLRRARQGRSGLVIPTQEKNLHVRLEQDRIRRLQSGDPY